MKWQTVTSNGMVRFVAWVATGLIACSAAAGTYTWDASGGAPLDDGNGNWNPTGGNNWYDGVSTYEAWGNTTADTAVFGVGNGAAGPITVGAVIANGVTFNIPGSGNYALSGGTITLGGETPAFTANVDATIASAIVGVGIGYTKSGSGILTLNSANTYSGDVTVDAGTLRSIRGNLGSNTGLGQNNTVTVSPGATLEVGGVNGTGDQLGASQLNTLTINGGTLNFSLTGTSGKDGPYLGVINLDGATVTTIAATSGPRWGHTQASGTINVTGNASTWSAPIWMLKGTGKTLTVNAVADFAMSGVMADFSGGYAGLPLIKSGNGTLTLSGANTFTGPVTIQAGMVVDGIASTTAGAFGAFNAAATKITVQSGATVDINGKAQASTSDFFYGMTIAGAGTSGQGALVNNGINGGPGNRSTPNITLSADATIGGSGHIYMINSGYSPDALNLGGYTLTKIGANTFFLCNTTVSAGTLSIAEGPVSVHRASDASAAAIALADGAGATLSLNGYDLPVGTLAGGDATGGSVSLGGNRLTVGGNSGSATYDGIISGTGGLTKTGTGTQTLAGTSTYSGTTAVNQGTLDLAGALGNSAVSVANGANLSGEGAVGSTGSLTFNDGANLRVDGSTGGALTVGSGATGSLTLNGTTTVHIDGMPVAAGAGTLIRVLNYHGALTGNAGNLALANVAAYRNATFSTTTPKQVDLSLDTKDLVWSGATAPWDINTSLNWNSGADMYLQGDSVSFTDAGATKAVTLNATVTPAAVAFNNSVGNDYTLSGSGAIAGTCELSKNGGGTLTLSGANTFSGDTTLSDGTLLIAANSTPSGVGSTVTSGPVGAGTLTLSGGTLQTTPSGAKSLANPIFVTPATTTQLRAGTGADLNLSGTISGSGTLALDSTISISVWLRGDPSAFTGTVTFKNNHNGTNFRLVDNAWDFGQASFVLSGGNANNRELIWNGTAGATVRMGALSGTAGLIGGGQGSAFTLEVGALGTTTSYAGRITTPASGAIGLTKVGGGTLTLAAANTFSGDVTVTGGTLRSTVGNIGGNTALGQNNTVTVNPGATLDVGGVNGTGNLIGASYGNTLTINGGGLNFSLTGPSGPDGPYLGVINLDGATVTGLATAGPRWGYSHASGTINVTGNASTWSAPVWLVYGAGKSLTVNAVADLAMSSVIADYSGALGGLPFIKSGTGTLTLSGPNTYTGTTDVDAGTLLLNGTHAAAGQYTVKSGATLGGGGTIASVVDVNGGGMLAPGGTNAAASLAINNDVTLTTTTDFHVNINGPTVDTQHDQLAMSAGTLQLNDATLTVVVGSGYTPTSGTVFEIVSSVNATGGMFADLTEGKEFVPTGSPVSFIIQYDNASNPKKIRLTARKIDSGTLFLVR